MRLSHVHRTTTRPLRANVRPCTFIRNVIAMCYIVTVMIMAVCAVCVFTIWFSPMFAERGARGIRRPDLFRRDRE